MPGHVEEGSLKAENTRLRRLLRLARRVLLALQCEDSYGVFLQALVEEGYASRALLAVAPEGARNPSRFHLAASVGEASPVLHDETTRACYETGEVVIDRSGKRAALPLLDEGRVAGILLLHHDGLAEPHGREIMVELADLASIMFRALRVYHKKASRSVTDGLTGLYNHAHFHHLLAATLGECYLLETPASLLMLDLDHFKSINDTHGHLVGDAVLKAVAMILRGLTRGNDVVARYGGEEFAVLLPGTGEEQALMVAERIRATVETYPFHELSPTLRRLTVSIGVATYRLGLGKNNFIRLADRALYLSKQAGRNRVTVLRPEDEL